MNKVILMGRLTRDPELRYTPSNVATCSFSVAVDRRYKSSDGTTPADFINCVAWRNTAEFISKYFVKGNRILIRGELQVRSYEDKNGEIRYVTEVVANDAEFCESRRNDGEGSPAYEGYYPLSEEDDDTVTF